MALGMTLNGAANGTFDGMRTALQFGSTSQQSINEGYRDFIALLRGLDATTDFRIANSIWYRQTFPFDATFLSTTRTYFDAEVRGLDFAAASTLSTINGWVRDNTAGRIPSIIDRVDPADVMYLINAIYFKGQWRNAFDPSETQPGGFRTAAGSTQQVPLMHQQTSLRYAQTPQLQVVELLYGNEAFAMDILLPAEGVSPTTTVASLTAPAWTDLMSQLHAQAIELFMPKLTLAYERTLNDDLKALGMAVAFQAGAADFTRMSPAGRELFISFVKQKAWVEINEVGTEAAAVTAVGISVTSLPSYPVVRVDRPFLFVIRERFSGTILFVGKILAIPPA
jgi:serpin B